MADTFTNAVDFPELSATPSNPPVGYRRLYAKSDGKAYQLTNAGVETELSNAAGGGGTPGGTDTQIQFNDAGVFNGDAGLTYNKTTDTLTLGGTDTGIILNGITNEPAAPAAGTGRLYAKTIAGRTMPKWVGPSGFDYPLQSSFAHNNIRAWKGGATIVATTFASQIGTLTYTGASPTAPTIPNPATTNIKSTMVRSVISTGATAGGLAYIRGNLLQIARGNAASIGGYYVVIRVGLAGLQAGNRVFAGIQDTAANPTNVDPTTTTTPGKIGLAINANTGNWNLVHNLTGTAPTVIALGANFPVNTTDALELALFCGANSAGVGYRVLNLTTNLSVSGTITTNQPANTTFLTPSIWCCNNATAAAVTMDFISCYIETDF